MAGTKGRSGGHNRRTADEKRFRGTARADRQPGAPTADEIGAPVRPDWLDSDPLAMAAWDRIVSTLLERRTITPGDRDAVLLAAKTESEFRRCDEIVLRDGPLITTERGAAAHPLLKPRESAWRRWSAALAVLGLQPVMRDRIARARAPSRDNPWEE